MRIGTTLRFPKENVSTSFGFTHSSAGFHRVEYLLSSFLSVPISFNTHVPPRIQVKYSTRLVTRHLIKGWRPHAASDFLTIRGEIVLKFFFSSTSNDDRVPLARGSHVARRRNPCQHPYFPSLNTFPIKHTQRSKTRLNREGR